jgi:hypothetical protein
VKSRGIGDFPQARCAYPMFAWHDTPWMWLSMTVGEGESLAERRAERSRVRALLWGLDALRQHRGAGAPGVARADAALYEPCEDWCRMARSPPAALAS